MNNTLRVVSFVWTWIYWLLLTGCHSGVTIDIRLSNRPAAAASLVVTAELNGQRASSGAQSLVPSPEHFRLQLDGVPTGLLSVHVRALDLAGCEMASGQNTLQIQGAGSYEFTVELLPSQGCSLELEFVGPSSGAVSISPLGVRCDSNCTQVLALGQQINLTAQTSGLFGGWFTDSGNSGCVGRAGCVITIGSGITKVRANFISPLSCLANGWCTEDNVPPTDPLFALWGNDRDEVWAVGNSGAMLRGDGLRWSTVPKVTNRSLRAIWGSSRSKVWATGEAGVLLHYDGTAWKLLPTLTPNWLLSLWGSSGHDVWAVGDGGTILHFDGSEWSLVRNRSDRSLRGVWGSSPQDVWFVGDQGTVLRWNGAELLPFDAGAQTNTLNAVWGTAANNIWIAGDAGTLLHVSGLPLTAERVDSKTVADLHGLFGVSPSAIWAVGTSATVLEWKGNGWGLVPTRFPATTALSGVWGSGSLDIWAVGLADTILRYRP